MNGVNRKSFLQKEKLFAAALGGRSVPVAHALRAAMLILLLSRFQPNPVPVPCLVWQRVRMQQATSRAHPPKEGIGKTVFRCIWSAADSIVSGEWRLSRPFY